MEDTTNDVLFYDEITAQFFTYTQEEIDDIKEFMRRGVIIENNIGNEDLSNVIDGKRIIRKELT